MRYLVNLFIYSSIFMFKINEIVSNSDKPCECVPYYLCDENQTIIKNGQAIIDIRMGPTDDCNYLEVCCQNVLTEPEFEDKDSNEGCGYRNADGITFQVAGKDNEAEFGEFPWMVAILQKNSGHEYSYKCGGSLIHPQVVLTAAHCVYSSVKYRIRAGEWDTRTTLEQYRHEEREVQSYIIHNEFNINPVLNDIALMFLESPFTIKAHINVACLPPKNHEELSKKCFVAGWGKDSFTDKELRQKILKKIQVPCVERYQCEKLFRKTRLGPYFNLDTSFMCAGGEEGKDACTGDGGSPLVCPIENQGERYQQVGIVVGGVECGVKDVPGAYVDVAYFRKWIDNEMNRRQFNTSTYTDYTSVSTFIDNTLDVV